MLIFARFSGDLSRKQGVTQNFYKFLNEVFEAKAAQHEAAQGESELLNTSMSKAFLNALGENLKSEVLEVILRIMARCIGIIRGFLLI